MDAYPTSNFATVDVNKIADRSLGKNSSVPSDLNKVNVYRDRSLARPNPRQIGNTSPIPRYSSFDNPSTR